VPQKLPIAKFSIPSCNFPFRKPTETSVASLANKGARRLRKSWTESYSAHFTSEIKKDKLKHVLKKLNPMQYVLNLLPFLLQTEKSEKVLLFTVQA